MEIKVFYAEGISHFSYAILAKSGMAVIDPKRDVEEYIELSERSGLPIKWILLTHCHADFISGHIRLSELTGAKVFAGRGMNAGYEVEELGEGERLDLGDLFIEVWETPGHTPEHVSFALYEKEYQGKTPFAVFTGDSLFAGSVGRPDLFGEDMREPLTEKLFGTVERFKALPDYVLIYPAHGAGSFCGKQLSQRCPTSVGYEKLFNPAMAFSDYEGFRNFILKDMPNPPSYYFEVSKRNRTGEGLDRLLTPLRPMTLKEFSSFEGLKVDLRDQACFAQAFIPGSLNVACDVHLAANFGFAIPIDGQIAFVGDGVREAQLVLYRMGYDGLKGYLLGGFEAWRNASLPVESFPLLSPKEVHQLVEKKEAVVLDVRTEGEFADEHILGALNVPLGRLKESVNDIPRDKLVVCQCGHGCRGSLAASILKTYGFNVANMAGGLIAWKSRGLPVEGL